MHGCVACSGYCPSFSPIRSSFVSRHFIPPTHDTGGHGYVDARSHLWQTWPIRLFAELRRAGFSSALRTDEARPHSASRGSPLPASMQLKMVLRPHDHDTIEQFDTCSLTGRSAFSQQIFVLSLANLLRLRQALQLFSFSILHGIVLPQLSIGHGEPLMFLIPLARLLAPCSRSWISRGRVRR